MKNFVIHVRQLKFLGPVKLSREVTEIGLPILVGLGLGALAVFIRDLPSKWAGALVLAVITPVFVLLLGDIKKVILIALVVDIPLGFDVAIQNHGDHRGGPTGYLVSLMTIVLVVGYALWITERSRSKVYSFKSVTVPLLVFIFMAVASIFQSANVLFSTFNIFLMIQVFLMYFYTINHIKTWADVRLVINTWAVCLALESAFMILPRITGSEISFAGVASKVYSDTSASVTGLRAVGTMGSPNAAAIWLTSSLVITMGAYLAYSELNLPGTRLTLLSFLIGAVGLVLTYSRSGWASFALAMLVLASLAIKRVIGRKRLTFLLVLILMVFSFFARPIVQRLTEDDRGSAEARKIGTEMAYNMIGDQPITGVGISNFDVRRFEYLPPELVGEPRGKVYIVHNHYLLTWSELGVFGLLSFVGILLAATAQGTRWINHRSDVRTFMLSASLLAALAGYSLHMGSDVFTSRMPVQLLWFMIALITAINHLARRPLPGSLE
jgi:putative inorganic carbon (HCO3(-)) transporter